jgi:hypothetical protein
MTQLEDSYKQLQGKLEFRLKVEKFIGDMSVYLVFSRNFNNAVNYFLSELAELLHASMLDGI